MLIYISIPCSLQYITACLQPRAFVAMLHWVVGNEDERWRANRDEAKGEIGRKTGWLSEAGGGKEMPSPRGTHTHLGNRIGPPLDEGSVEDETGMTW